MEAPKEAYPLTWPASQRRIAYRTDSRYQDRGFGRIRDELLNELRLLDASRVVISSNIPLRLDGLPYANAREPDDAGIAVYFQRKGKPYVIACDQFLRTWENLRAIALTIESLRAIERHGASSMLEQAFTGFAALPAARAAEASWWETLQTERTSTIEHIKAARDYMAMQAHPDRGGTDEAMARINRAYSIALEEKKE